MEQLDSSNLKKYYLPSDVGFIHTAELALDFEHNVVKISLDDTEQGVRLSSGFTLEKFEQHLQFLLKVIEKRKKK